MADDGVQYEFKSVQAIRGIEARSIAKWQKAGWEFVDQKQGTLRTTLNFRRPKPKVPWVLIAVAAGVVLLVAVVGGVASALQGGGDKDPKPTKSPSEATVVASGKPSETPKPEESASDASEADRVLTVENSKDLAALLAVRDYCDETIGTFAAKYEGRTIEFDGSIASMLNHGDYKTRYDILVSPGKGPKSVVGPAFKFEDVNVLDLHLTGANIPDSVGTGDLLHVVARVGEYNPDQCLFFLEPVATKIR
ncbi:DUF4839 domain-containing protein [Micromonospora coerulea]|uniref:DUF4839 domain-containing protein n=1 Tax=Micromonospora coerulea TaxID=47856 RepID=UPI001902CDBB|nr:DUF4839 domain-containing protein [Micromonospora veneta]